MGSCPWCQHGSPPLSETTIRDAIGALEEELSMTTADFLALRGSAALPPVYVFTYWHDLVELLEVVRRAGG
ncbi:hypothetical protein [Miltoncostaea marina]|uniref:hypothetical protein n=1 Tax=Miltoncostaea marina TaxID=2843215 RepID=UPI001C3E82EE|nr:hypothetical protein [Miltoncostaea marina]